MNYVNIRRNKIFKEFYNNTIINVNPKKVEFITTTYQYSGPITNKLYSLPKIIQGRATGYLASKILLMEPFFFGNFKIKPICIDNEERFILIKELLDQVDNYKDSIWYKRLAEKVYTEGFVFHKGIKITNLSELDTFFKGTLKMSNEISKKGFNVNNHLIESGVIIDHDFNIIKASHGNHRFFIAKLLNVVSYPCLIEKIHRKIYLNYIKERNLRAISSPDDFEIFLNFVKDNINNG